MNVDGCTDPVFNPNFCRWLSKKIGGEYWISRWMDVWMDKWMKRNGWIRCRWADK
jgi:hypothetical protein